MSSFAFLSFLSFPPLIQLVPTQTRRARLPVCARKPLGGQVLFAARTISRPIVAIVIVVDVVARTHDWRSVLLTDDALRQLHIHRRLRRRVSRVVGERIVKVSERSSRSVASTGIRGGLDRSTRRRSVVSSPRPVSFSRARPHRHPFRRRSRARVQRPLCIKRERHRHRLRAARSVDRFVLCARDASPHR